MKRFLTVSLWFSIPLIIFLFIPFWLLFSSRENFYNIDNIFSNMNKKKNLLKLDSTRRQAAKNRSPAALRDEDFEQRRQRSNSEFLEVSKKYLIGYIYNERNIQYVKFKFLREVPNPEVLILGSSRVLQFRKEMFRSGFYNAGFTVESILDFKAFLGALPVERYPKYLIIGLDQWMFHPEGMNWSTKKEPEFWTTNYTSGLGRGFSNFVNVYKDLLAGKISVAHYNEPVHSGRLEYIGLNAAEYNQGIRNDGSYYYGRQISKLLYHDTTAFDYKFNDTFDRIKKGNRRFDYSDTLNNRALFILDDFLKFCHEKNIFVTGFLPPFANAVYNQMMSTGKYRYILQLGQNIAPVFAQYGFEFYPFYSLADCNSQDDEAIDGFHGGEVAYLKLLIKILENNSKLNSVCDLNKLKTELSGKKNSLCVYEEL